MCLPCPRLCPKLWPRLWPRLRPKPAISEMPSPRHARRILAAGLNDLTDLTISLFPFYDQLIHQYKKRRVLRRGTQSARGDNDSPISAGSKLGLGPDMGRGCPGTRPGGDLRVGCGSGATGYGLVWMLHPPGPPMSGPSWGVSQGVLCLERQYLLFWC